jgi:tungstate transport system substrate-binding protein
MDVSPALHPHVNHDGAVAFIEWLASEKGQKMIGNYTLEGKTLFFPSAK